MAIRRGTFRCCAALLAFISLSPLASAQEPKGDLQHEVSVTLKLIQVFVTDKRGNPVKDLTKEDFQLFVRGKPVVITDFESHFSEIKKSENIETKVDAVRPKQQNRISRKFLFILDYLENDLAGISQSKRAFNFYIDNQLTPEDEVAVLSYSAAEGFVLHEYFSSDRESLKQTVKDLRRIPGFRTLGRALSLDDDYRTRNEIRIPDLIALSGFDTLGHILYREYFIQDMKDLARALRLIPGTKNIVFFSHGLLFNRTLMDMRSNYEEMCDEMAHAGASIFAIDTAGFRGARDELWMKRPMQMLAKRTGGQYFSSVEYYETFSPAIQNLTNNYYVLGFTITESLDGKFQKLKVKVNRKGCRVHTQGGYYNPKPFSEFNDIERRLHLIDLAFNDEPHFQEPLDFPLKAFGYDKNGTQNAMLLSELDTAGLGEVLKGKTEIVVFVADDENNIMESALGRVRLNALDKRTVYLFSALAVPPGAYQCRVVLRNRDTGEGAVGSADLMIPPSQESGTRFFPPLLLHPSSDCRLVSLLPKGSAEILLKDIYPYMTNDQAVLFDVIDRGYRRIRACFTLATEHVEKDRVELSFTLTPMASDLKLVLPHEVLSCHRNGKLINLLAEMDLPELDPGMHSLEIICRDERSKEMYRHTVHFRIKD
jgi:VWFA-related protein